MDDKELEKIVIHNHKEIHGYLMIKINVLELQVIELTKRIEVLEGKVK